MFFSKSNFAVLNGRMQTVRRRPSEELDLECMTKTIQHSQKIMVWGAIFIYGNSHFEIIDDIWNQFKYIDVLVWSDTMDITAKFDFLSYCLINQELLS